MFGLGNKSVKGASPSKSCLGTDGLASLMLRSAYVKSTMSVLFIKDIACLRICGVDMTGVVG